MIALLAGATGLVGQELLSQLLADPRYEAVHCVGRRALAATHPKLHTHVVNLAHLQASAKSIPVAHDVYVALGTTIKAAGSQSSGLSCHRFRCCFGCSQRKYCASSYAIHSK